MNKAYLISVATAAALGYSAGFVSDGILEASAASLDRKVTVTKCFDNGNAVIANIWDKVDTAMCADAAVEAGIDVGDCSVETGTVSSFTRGTEQTCNSTTFNFGGTWVFGAPQ